MPYYASTPQAAALNVYAPRRHAVVTKVTIAGRYAVVFTRNGSIEGSPATTPLLLERFSFGWQPVDLIHAPCQVRSAGMTSSDITRLGAGVPNAGGIDARCGSARHDVGAAADIDAVRHIANGPLVPFVAISCAYGFASWYAAGGGEEFFKKQQRVWKRIGGGGGAVSAPEARAMYGIPESAIRAFGIPETFAKP